PELQATTYTYTLYYYENLVTFKDTDGVDCIPGTTLIESSLHPCFTITAAMRLFANGNGLKEWRNASLPFYTFTGPLINEVYPRSFFAENPELERKSYWVSDEVFEERQNRRRIRIATASSSSYSVLP
ncbi:hypothetical protein H0H92_011863, partial [Tricholoma furcatifolium]